MSVADEAREHINQKHPGWHDRGVGIVQGSHYRAGFVAGAQWQASRKVEVTDEMAGAAGRVIMVECGESDREFAEWVARVALEAALGGHTKGEDDI